MDERRQIKYLQEMRCLIQDFENYAAFCNELWGTASPRDAVDIKRDIKEYERRVSRSFGRLGKLLRRLLGNRINILLRAVQTGWHQPYHKGPLLEPSISILNNALGEIETMSDEDIQKALSDKPVKQPSSVTNYTTTNNVYGNNSGGVNTGSSIQVQDNSTHVTTSGNFDPIAQVNTIRKLLEPVVHELEERLAQRLLRELDDLETEIQQKKPDKSLLKRAATGIVDLTAKAVTIGQANLPLITSNLNGILNHFGIGTLHV